MQENNFQIRYNSRHERGWTDSYFISYNDQQIGYGSLASLDDPTEKDTVFEFYIVPPFRNLAAAAFQQLLLSSKAKFIEAQSNDLLLSSLLYQFGQDINSDVILFEEGSTTNMSIDNVIFRKRRQADLIFEHKTEPVGEFVLELEQEIVATGGFLLHYNMPFADLYMEVKEDFRRRGLGSLLIQELKKQCYLSGRVPAARTGIENLASKATLLKAGLKIAGHMLMAKINDSYYH